MQRRCSIAPLILISLAATAGQAQRISPKIPVDVQYKPVDPRGSQVGPAAKKDYLRFGNLQIFTFFSAARAVFRQSSGRPQAMTTGADAA